MMPQQCTVTHDVVTLARQLRVLRSVHGPVHILNSDPRHAMLKVGHSSSASNRLGCTLDEALIYFSVGSPPFRRQILPTFSEATLKMPSGSAPDSGTPHVRTGTSCHQTPKPDSMNHLLSKICPSNVGSCMDEIGRELPYLCAPAPRRACMGRSRACESAPDSTQSTRGMCIACV